MTSRIDAREMLGQLSANTYREAYKSGTNLSVWLDRNMVAHEDGMDGFQRLLFEAGVATRSAPEVGIFADTWERLHETPQLRALVPELIAREWRSVQIGRRYSSRALYTSSDGALGTLANAYTTDMTGRWNEQLSAAIPVSELVAITTPINSGAYQAYYLKADEGEQSMSRVAEGAEIPRFKLTAGKKTIQLHKFGGALQATYEQLRRQPIDQIAMHIQRIAVQAEVDKVAKIINVAVNGDGNNNAATVHALTTLDSSAAVGTPTIKAWLAFKMKFANPYQMTHALTQDDVALDLALLNMGSANIPLVALASSFGGFTMINQSLRDGVALGWTGDAPASKVVGIDGRLGIQRVVEIGATIQEVERYIHNQTELLTMTETEGYAKLDDKAVHVLDLAA